MRGAADHPQAVGRAPSIPAGKPQGSLPTLKTPTARGWGQGQTPQAGPGLKVNAFAAGLKHPRWINVLPNGDVLVAEALMPTIPIGNLFDYAMYSTLKRAAAVGVSPNRITLLRDTNQDGVAETRETFMEGLNQPFGMALLGETFYVGNTDGIMAFPYEAGANRIGAGRRLTTFKTGGHWTRSLLASVDGQKLYAGVGSLSNIAEGGLKVEEGRACIYELDLASGSSRVFASSLRPRRPRLGALYRCSLDGGHRARRAGRRDAARLSDLGARGWVLRLALLLLGQDRRRPGAAGVANLVAKAIQPDFALGGHTASLGLCWVPAGTLPGFPDGMAIGQHGSWNRSKLSGYRVVFVPFKNGRPSGPPRDILTGFLAPDEKSSFGRPVGVTLGPDGSLLVADDVGNVIWRVTGA